MSYTHLAISLLLSFSSCLVYSSDTTSGGTAATSSASSSPTEENGLFAKRILIVKACANTYKNNDYELIAIPGVDASTSYDGLMSKVKTLLDDTALHICLATLSHAIVLDSHNADCPFNTAKVFDNLNIEINKNEALLSKTVMILTSRYPKTYGPEEIKSHDQQFQAKFKQITCKQGQNEKMIKPSYQTNE